MTLPIPSSPTPTSECGRREEQHPPDRSFRLGKTHLVKSLASYLNVPLVIGDATSLTEAGYVGDDVESLLSKLIQAAEGDMEVAQRGIVYIDEIDKIQRSGSGFKDLRQGVQHALLKMLEGTIATVPPAGRL